MGAQVVVERPDGDHAWRVLVGGREREDLGARWHYDLGEVVHYVESVVGKRVWRFTATGVRSVEKTEEGSR